MSLNLPERASYEYLKKLAKERLALLRTRNLGAKLADAQLSIAREYGFSSWRALKVQMDIRQAPHVVEFMRACGAGDLETLRELLQKDRGLARERLAGGTTGLHMAVRHPEAVRLLLEHGADPNARDVGDNATPLHFAAANGTLDTVRLLLDSGADVHGSGDVHNGDVIGWAAREGNEALVTLLLERDAEGQAIDEARISIDGGMPLPTSAAQGRTRSAQAVWHRSRGSSSSRGCTRSGWQPWPRSRARAGPVFFIAISKHQRGGIAAMFVKE